MGDPSARVFEVFLIVSQSLCIILATVDPSILPSCSSQVNYDDSLLPVLQENFLLSFILELYVQDRFQVRAAEVVDSWFPLMMQGQSRTGIARSVAQWLLLLADRREA